MSSYLDTNVIVSLFRAEPTSAQTVRWLRQTAGPIVVSDFGAVEFAAVLSRDVRAETISEPDAKAVLARFDLWLAQAVTMVSLSAASILRADVFVRDFSTKLQAPDALHLALAVQTGSTLATFDLRLTEAARLLEIPVLAPR